MKAEEPKPFNERFDELRKDYPSERITWLMVKADGLMLLGGDKELAKALNDALGVVMERRRAAKAKVEGTAQMVVTPRRVILGSNGQPLVALHG